MSDLNVNDYTTEEILDGLKLLEAKRLRQKRIDAGEIKGPQTWANKTEEQKQRHKDYNKKRNAKIKLLIEKAKEAGIEI